MHEDTRYYVFDCFCAFGLQTKSKAEFNVWNNCPYCCHSPFHILDFFYRGETCLVRGRLFSPLHSSTANYKTG